MIYGNSTTMKEAPIQEASQGERTLSYGNSPNQAAETGGSMLGSYQTGNPPTGQSQDAEIGDRPDVPKPPTIEHAPDGGGDPPTSYQPHLGAFFDGRLVDANVLNQPELVEQLETARKQLDGVLKEYQVGDSAARQIFTTVDGYIRNPRTPEAMDMERESTMAALEKKWQGETEAMIKTAQRVLNELDKKVPGLADSIVSSGAANNAELIAHLANLGKKHGAKFTNSMGVSMLDSLWSKKY